jgi:uncharacterized protein (DUF2141 family)
MHRSLPDRIEIRLKEAPIQRSSLMRLPPKRQTKLPAAIAALPALVLAALLALPQSAIAEPAAKLSLTVTGIKDAKGALMIAVFDEAGYDADSPVAQAAIPVTGPAAAHSFDGLKPGKYGIKMFHDVDGDGKMGTNPFGMPVEPFAFSNNAKGQFGPATWRDAAFDVAGSTSHTIKLN